MAELLLEAEVEETSEEGGKVDAIIGLTARGNTRQRHTTAHNTND